MRLISFQYHDTFARAGALLGAVVDLAAAAPLVFEDLPVTRLDLLALLRGGSNELGLDSASEIMWAVLDQLGLEDAAEFDEAMLHGGISMGGEELLLPLDRVRLLPPLPHPVSLRDFFAFEAHVAAGMRLRNRPVPPAWYDVPVFYFGNHTAIYGPDAEIPYPRTRKLDYELELACVIGRNGRDISEEDAVDYIAGFTILNDWSARDLQAEEMSVGLGPAKGKDFATSIGPWLVTPDELTDYELPDGRHNLVMTAHVNGIERSRGNARDMYYTFAQLIARASQDATLFPGDIIASGTVGTGCLLEQTGGQGPWLQPGDKVEMAISGLGVLRNRVAERDD
jgi:fumarylacetoacetate (FAA) hydrolase